MADDKDRKGLKSTGGQKSLRSRGFLSQPGGTAVGASEKTGGAEALEKEHRSRGARPISASADRKPQALADKPLVKPYRLEDK